LKTLRISFAIAFLGMVASCAPKSNVQALEDDVEKLQNQVTDLQTQQTTQNNINNEQVAMQLKQNENISSMMALATKGSGVERRGMTWGMINDAKSRKGVVHVGCDGDPKVNNPNSPKCNPYQGDTECDQKLPVLCLNKTKPIACPADLVTDSGKQWSGGEVRLTMAMEGTKLDSLSAADQICKNAFGTEWKIAEFHDGSGWGLWAQGNMKPKERFWVFINDQNANCWDK
jgi:hypothetical protein